jgi:hypothetical protein
MRVRALVILTMIVAGSLLSGCGDQDGRVLRSGSTFVLVGASGAARTLPHSTITGRVGIVGDCLGINGSAVNGATVIWPHGTKITADDPLTIEVPGLGRVRVGDSVDGSGDQVVNHRPGQEHLDRLPKGVDRVPTGCRRNQVIAFYP